MIWKRARFQATLIDGDRRSTISMAQGRLSILSVCFVLGYMLVMIRLIDLSIVQGENIFYKSEDHVFDKSLGAYTSTVRRGDIYDRHGFLLATTLKTPSVFVDPALVLDVDDLASRLTHVFPELKHDDLAKVLGADNRFGWIKRHVTPKQQEQVLALGEPSLGFKYEHKRVYPQKSLFSHMVGYTDRDGIGLSGLERGYDTTLREGKHLHLSLDLRLQHIVRREVSTAISDFNAKAGVGVILDVKTGAVLAGVSLPDYDLNLASKANDNEKFNRLTLGVYELGSMFKIFSTAALLELHKVSMGHTFDARKPIKIGRFTINDYHAQKRILTVPEVFMHSSNIGSALMGEMVGGEKLKDFYADLGLLGQMQFGIKEAGFPIVPDPWRKVNTYTAAYGHGLATTPMQMSAAVATVINGGLSVSPTFLKQEEPSGTTSEVQILSEETSDKMRRLMRLVVTEGTGKNADAKGYTVGGKTGTAEKSINGRYDHSRLISSFVAAFPMDDPDYVIMVMVDEPKGNKESYGYATAGWVAAPAVKRIVVSMASILGLPADKYDPKQDIGNSLLPYLQKETAGGKKLVSY